MKAGIKPVHISTGFASRLGFQRKHWHAVSASSLGTPVDSYPVFDKQGLSGERDRCDIQAFCDRQARSLHKRLGVNLDIENTLRLS